MTAVRPISNQFRAVRHLLAVAAITIAAGSIAHTADPIQIVALGASNTAGKGVGASAAWPARLQAMLRANGHNVRVINAGISGDDTARMAARVNRAVPNGTLLVILDKAADNDRKRGINTAGNVAAIQRNLQARNIKSIVIPGMHGWAGKRLQADGIHITSEGHSAVAARLFPLVAAAVGK